MNLNESGIEVYNNQSTIIDNIIERSHENGIKITGTDKSQMCTAVVWKNRIISCGFNGILIQGDQCKPDVRGNIIQQNRRAGIKLTELAVAHIGGTTKADIKFIPTSERDKQANNTFQTAKVEAAQIFEEENKQGNEYFLESEREGNIGGGNKINKLQELHVNVNSHTIALKVKSFPNANVIENNYNQGILIVEGSYAHIISNKIEGNIKANVALGGKKSGQTKIKYNYILNSKSGEGVFVIEGEDGLVIEDNQIESNNDGIVLVNS